MGDVGRWVSKVPVFLGQSSSVLTLRAVRGPGLGRGENDRSQLPNTGFRWGGLAGWRCLPCLNRQSVKFTFNPSSPSPEYLP